MSRAQLTNTFVMSVIRAMPNRSGRMTPPLSCTGSYTRSKSSRRSVSPSSDTTSAQTLVVIEPPAVLRKSSGRGMLARARKSRTISGGLPMQTIDRVDAVVEDESGAVTGGDDPAHWRLVCGAAADEATLRDLQFAWRAVRSVKSNAILLARDGATVGIGMGQVNRVDSCRLAVARAGAERARGAVAASDAFFPFADGLQILLDAGVTAVVAPGGSIRDEEVVAAAEAAGVTMYFTGTRHFAH